MSENKKTRADAAAEAAESESRQKQDEIDAERDARTAEGARDPVEAAEAAMRDEEDFAAYERHQRAEEIRSRPKKEVSGPPFGSLYVPDFGFTALTWTAAKARIAAAPTDWLVRDLVTSATYGVLAGTKGIGKTFALLDLAVSVALGEPWLGRFDCAQHRALVLLGEDGEAEAWRRARAIARSKARDPEELDGELYIHPEPVNFTDRKALEILAEELDRPDIGSGYGLVIIDPAYKYLGGVDASNLFAMGDALAPLQAACAKVGAALIIGHHFNRKMDATRQNRLSGAGLLEWGRVIVTLDGKDALPGESRVIDFQASGNSIADVALTLRRTIERTGPEADADYVYDVEIVAEGAAAVAGNRGASAAKRIHAVMTEDRSARWLLDELVEAVNADGGPELKQSTISAALRKQLKHVVQTDAIARKPGGQWWLPETATFGEAGIKDA